MTTRSRFRWAWGLLAYLALGLGFIGIFLPGLPTVPFVLLAAFAAARGSEKLHQRLLADPRFGPMIRDWQAHGAISRRAKWLATITMAACAVLLLGLMVLVPAHRWWMTALPLACMGTVCVWLWRRPEPPGS